MSRLAIRGLLSILLIAVCAEARALDPSLQPTQYVLDNWQIPDGLPQSTVQAVARTPDGYLWVGTQEGLARFDGVRFTVFDSGNESAIPNKDITACTSTGPDGCGSERARASRVSRMALHAVQHNRRELAHAYMRAITECKDGHIWVGTETGCSRSAARRAFVRCVERAQRQPHPCVGRRPRRCVLGRHGSGLQRFDGKRFEVVPFARRRGVPVTALHEDADGALWIGTGSGALYRRTGGIKLRGVAEAGRSARRFAR
jgi:ligand-binding sensor domain-containing protein